MPKGPRGERRPADVIGNAVRIMKIATGQVEEKIEAPDPAKAHMREGGLKGGKARADRLTKEQRKEIARTGALARWSKRN